MKNTQIRCGTGRIRTANLSFITSALPSYYPSYRPNFAIRFSSTLSPLKGAKHNPFDGMATAPTKGTVHEKLPLLCSSVYNRRFLLYSSLDSKGQLLFSPPGSRCQAHHQPGRLDLLQVCGLPLSCCQHVKELCCVPQGGLALSILPGHGRHCSCATAAALIARGREVDQTSECA